MEVPKTLPGIWKRLGWSKEQVENHCEKMGWTIPKEQRNSRTKKYSFRCPHELSKFIDEHPNKSKKIISLLTKALEEGGENAGSN